MGRNVAYLREETHGGAKDSNDTISTLFDWVLGAPMEQHGQPPLCRTGYDANGAIPGVQHGQAEVGVEVDVEHAQADSSGIGIPAGFKYSEDPPLPDEAFIIGAEDDAALLGSTVMIYDKKAWHVAEIIEQVKGTRHKHNFTIMHEDESVQNVLLDPNLHGTEEGQNAWVWLEHHMTLSAEALSNEMVAVDPCDYAIPVGFKAQLNPPPAAALEPKGSAGVQLLQRKIMMRWEKYGWCKGDHILNPHIIIS